MKVFRTLKAARIFHGYVCEVRCDFCADIKPLLSATAFWVYFAILVILRITEMPDGSEVTNEANGSEERGVFPHGRG